jgi:hypothetical protein
VREPKEQKLLRRCGVLSLETLESLLALALLAAVYGQKSSKCSRTEASAG